MKRNLLIVFIFCFFHASAQYSNPITKAYSAGLELGIPTNSIYSIGLGVSGKAEIPVSKNIWVTVTAGYTTFFYKSNLYQSSLTPSPAGFVPLKAGTKYYFNEGVYIEGELGTAIETNYLKQDLFVFSVGPGFIIPINDSHGIDLSFRYEGWSNHQFRQTAIRVAYRFGRSVFDFSANATRDKKLQIFFMFVNIYMYLFKYEKTHITIIIFSTLCVW